MVPLHRPNQNPCAFVGIFFLSVVKNQLNIHTPSPELTHEPLNTAHSAQTLIKQIPSNSQVGKNDFTRSASFALTVEALLTINIDGVWD